MLTEFVRFLIVTGFCVLAITLPVVILSHVGESAKRRTYLLVAMIWFIFAAGVYAVARDWAHDAPLAAPNDVLRGLAIIAGFSYLVMAWRAVAARRDAQKARPTHRANGRPNPTKPGDRL